MDLMYHGIQLSMQFQRALVRTGVAIIDKQVTKTLKSFRLTVITGITNGRSNSNVSSGTSSGMGAGGMVGDSDFALFGKSVPLLLRLGCFLMEAYKVSF